MRALQVARAGGEWRPDGIRLCVAAAAFARPTLLTFAPFPQGKVEQYPPQSDFNWHVKIGVDRMSYRAAQCEMWRRAAMPPRPLPALPPGWHALQGVYAADYGPHGVEVLRIELAAAGEPPPPGCSLVGGPRLQPVRHVTGVVPMLQDRPGRVNG